MSINEQIAAIYKILPDIQNLTSTLKRVNERLESCEKKCDEVFSIKENLLSIERKALRDYKSEVEEIEELISGLSSKIKHELETESKQLKEIINDFSVSVEAAKRKIDREDLAGRLDVVRKSLESSISTHYLALDKRIKELENNNGK